jgi:hypothetical protein
MNCGAKIWTKIDPASSASLNKYFHRLIYISIYNKVHRQSSNGGDQDHTYKNRESGKNSNTKKWPRKQTQQKGEKSD